MQYTTLEYLLKQDEMNRKLDPIRKPEEIIEPKPKKLQAEKSADLDDFFRMVGEVVSKTMKKDKVYFNPDEGARVYTDPEMKIENPVINFSVLSCEPELELKPRVRLEVLEEVDDVNNTHSQRKGRVFGQRFKCYVQFNIIACDYIQANKVMKTFEDLIFNYTAYFKENGVAELIFESRFTDRNLDEYRQKCSIRSLKYFVVVEKNYVVYDTQFSQLLT